MGADFWTQLWSVSEAARGRGRLSAADVVFATETVPRRLASFPELKLPDRLRHPAGFTISGAPRGTFVRSGLLFQIRPQLRLPHGKT